MHAIWLRWVGCVYSNRAMQAQTWNNIVAYLVHRPFVDPLKQQRSNKHSVFAKVVMLVAVLLVLGVLWVQYNLIFAI
jgi:hypothetical protein